MAFANDPVKSLIRHEDGRWYWLSRQGCNYRVESGAGAGGRVTFVMPGGLERLAPATACRHTLGGFAWTGRQAIMSWVIASEASMSAHLDLGLQGAVVAGPRATE